MTETLEQEQADNKVQMQAITDKLRVASSTDSDVRQFIGEIREHASTMELGKIILNQLIDKIIKSLSVQLRLLTVKRFRKSALFITF